ncbi:MAG TPA: DUF5683 domain-containing protein [Chitinophagales bacterium]|nr:DUF5683 domain-containing protein [Chitinophagales bacterium]
MNSMNVNYKKFRGIAFVFVLFVTIPFSSFCQDTLHTEQPNLPEQPGIIATKDSTQSLLLQTAPDSSIRDSSQTARQQRIRKFYWDSSKYPVTADSSLKAKKLRRHSPLYAALFSTVLPGLGQAYNKKYWKIPIVYAGLGGLSYALYYTASNFRGYRNAYRAQVALVPDPFASYNGISDEGALKTYRDYFKRSLDATAICTGVFYILNIVDAAVDAHLFEWNMKDDIHLSWQPTVQTGYYYAAAAPGVRLNLNF